ncbi:hypothetical protein Tsubulata_036954 [Turnera subulata]|uniref:Uncharacterized protein n=1 Tax=Turnera subulata TaxID=218843 RepID=A0A9Q0F543_9ROSI|nr:hypothetical protein Tsubulata_036954 [Turnera subulata]
MSSNPQSTFSSAEQSGFCYQGNLTSGTPQCTFPSLQSTGIPPAETPQMETEEGMDSAIVAECLNDTLQGQDRFVRTWEGAISALVGGELMTICGAVAYRMTSTSYKVAADWPRTLQLGRLLCQDFFEKFPKTGPKDRLIIEATNHHSILDHLKARKLCSNVKLPSQTMIFSPTNKDRYFLATVFPGEYPIYRSKIPASVQQQQQPQTQRQEQQK